MPRDAKEMADFLAGVVGAVEANSYEQMCIWQDYHKEHGMSWNARAQGFLETVGHVGDMPVCISLQTVEIDGHKILFYEATSQVVDYRLVEAWLEKTLPDTARDEGRNGYLNRTDAMNFHNVMHSARRRSKAPVTDAGRAAISKATAPTA